MKRGGKFVLYQCVCLCVSVSVDGDVLVLELKEFYTRYTNDVIATAAFGIGVDSFRQPTNEFYMMGQDATYIGGLRAFKWLAYVSMPKLMQVSTIVKNHLHRAQPSLVPILSQLHPLLTLSPHFLHINFNIMLPSTSRSSKWFFSSHLPTTILDEFSPIPATHLAKIHL